MIPNCKGCNIELRNALFYQDELNLHLATCSDYEQSYPVGKHHFFLIMVNDKGEIMVW